MNGKINLQQKTSFTALWNTIESIYGEIPEIIKIVLQLNGFDSFLALRGIRYDDKNQFFTSLESTIMEILNSQDDTEEKKILNKLLSTTGEYKQFKLKPGHRNLVMNLMLEIDKVDVEEFFNKARKKSPNETIVPIEEESIEETLEIPSHQIKSSPKANDETIYQVDYIHTEHSMDKIELPDQNEMGEVEYILEEEYIDEKPNNFEHSYMLKVDEFDSEVSYEFLNTTTQKKKPKQKKRKPDRMYNDEFLSQFINPRRRRLTTLKTYTDNDEGICERFSDLIQQSMQCILSQSMLEEIGNAQIVVTKETDTSYTVICPLCNTKIKLPVVYENNGRYRNYKRSNFERHLRFKHCKNDNNVSEASN